jgi:prepilin-type N-terminal cleavage/methylation domain-containing protein
LKSGGFTLIELMAVLVILSVWSAIGVKKVVGINETVEKNFIEQAVVELNTRESLLWFKIKMSKQGYADDESLWSKMDTNLGAGYRWNSGPDITGGELGFRSAAADLARNPSEKTYPGQWNM